VACARGVRGGVKLWFMVSPLCITVQLSFSKRRFGVPQMDCVWVTCAPAREHNANSIETCDIYACGSSRRGVNGNGVAVGWIETGERFVVWRQTRRLHGVGCVRYEHERGICDGDFEQLGTQKLEFANRC